MRKEHLQSKRASSSPGLMVLAGHLTLDSGSSGRPFPRKDLVALPFASGHVPSVGNRTRTRRGTQVPAHPNNVRPLARSGQCLASPAQSPAGSPPHSPQGPIEFGRVWSTGLATLAACFSPPPPRVEVKYRGPGMGGGGSKARARSSISNNQVQVRSWDPSRPVPSKPSLGPRPAQAQDPTKAHPPVPQSPVPESPGQGANQAGEQASKLWPCVFVCARPSWCVRACRSCGVKFVPMCACVRVRVLCECERV